LVPLPILLVSVVDSDSLNPGLDPDPAFQVNPDLIQIRGFYNQKFKGKNAAENFFFSFFDQKLQFTFP
jgi:hypothetical protein